MPNTWLPTSPLPKWIERRREAPFVLWDPHGVPRETPYGSVDAFHAGGGLAAWWIDKVGEEIDPAWSTCDRDDLLYVVEGTLRLELEGQEPRDLAAGEVFVIPENTPFRGYRWPRDSERCRFLAVAPESATFT